MGARIQPRRHTRAQITQVQVPGRGGSEAASRHIHYDNTVTKSYYPIFFALFAATFLISNINATKGVVIGPLITDGAFFLFPLAYVIGDVLSECYGFAATRKAVFTSFFIAILAVLSFYVAIWLPPADFYTGQEAFTQVLGLVPQIVIASLAGYVAGQLLNSFVLIKIRERTGQKQLWARLIGSTLVGEFVDTLIFCLIAAPVIGITDVAGTVNYVIVGFLWKTAMEIVVMPITYAVIAWVRRTDPVLASSPVWSPPRSR
ncbi:MAG: queuosine precursor transporter [Corynebacterium sp.]|nr:queuosine precursor transporter [Corynebacterium sp.]